MAIELLYASLHISGDIANPDNALGNTPSTWAGSPNAVVSPTSRYAISDPVNPLTSGATQTINVFCRKGTNTGTPNIIVSLYENGVLIRSEPSVAVNSTTATAVPIIFTDADITNPNNVEIEVNILGVGGNANTRNSVEVSHFEWSADTSVYVKSASGTGSLSGNGSLTSAGSKAAQGSSSISGNGSLTVVGSKTSQGTGLISGAGSLTAVGFVPKLAQGSGSISAAGALTSAGSKAAQGSSSISGNGTLTSIGVKGSQGSSSISDNGTLTSIGSKTSQGTGLISGAGSLTAVGIQEEMPDRFGSANLSGGGSLISLGFAKRLGTGQVSGNGLLQSTGIVSKQGFSVVSGNGIIFSNGTKGGDGVGVINGGGNLVVVGIPGRQGFGSISGAGSLTAFSIGPILEVTLSVGFSNIKVITLLAPQREDVRVGLALLNNPNYNLELSRKTFTINAGKVVKRLFDPGRR